MAFKEKNLAEPTRHNPYLHQIVINEIRKGSRGYILDLPSGPGYLLRDLKVDGFHGIAAEIDPELHCFDDVEYKVVDMNAPLPFANESFDIVTCIEGIEHIENHFQFLREVRRVLKKGGKLYLTTPNVMSLESRWGFLWSGFHSLAPKPIPLDSENIYFEHINPLSLAELYFSCTKSKLSIEKLLTHRYRKGSKIIYYLFFPFVMWSLWSACFRKEKNPNRQSANKEIYALLRSKENLLGSHTIIVATAE